MERRHWAWGVIPPDQADALLGYAYSEVDEDVPWCGPYEAIAASVPVARTIVDFGCYMGLQAVCFAKHARYIGVDHNGVDGEPLPRLQLDNTIHHTADIRDVCGDPSAFGIDPRVDFAVCCWVPDFAATEMVRSVFANCFIMYPDSGDLDAETGLGDVVRRTLTGLGRARVD